MTSVSILGATGTIGQNCLKVMTANPGMFELEAITANQNVEALAAIATTTGANFAAIADESKYQLLKDFTSGLKIEIAAGDEGLQEAAARESDIVVAGIVGTAGLKPTLKAVERGARVALANKECLVAAGDVFMQEAADHNATLIPVDSEHSAIFQILRGGNTQVSNITLTASGGPFREMSLEQMMMVTPEVAVKHPNWEMGAKISVDSATMANKGLELIEAKHLFGLEPDQLNVLVHPESIIHGLVSYRDGSVLAQLSAPDMRVPLAYALGLPRRIESGVKPVDLLELGKLHFEEPDVNRFPAFGLARQALRAGGSAPTVFNAANEVAVAAFLEGNIGFLDISSVIDETMQTMEMQPIPTLGEALQFDTAARANATKLIANILLSQTG